MKDSVVISLGTFDGLHIGHQFIINKTVSLAKEKNLKSVVYTFKNIPSNLLKKPDDIQIMCPEDKFKLIKEMGVDYIVMEDFDEKLMYTEKEDFLENLCSKYNIKDIVVGSDYRFGRGGEGDPLYMISLSDKYNYDVHITDFISDEFGKISSSRIRKALLSLEIEKANEMLGRNYSFKANLNLTDVTDGFYTYSVKFSDLPLFLKADKYKINISGKNFFYRSVIEIYEDCSTLVILRRIDVEDPYFYKNNDFRIELLNKI